MEALFLVINPIYDSDDFNYILSKPSTLGVLYEFTLRESGISVRIIPYINSTQSLLCVVMCGELICTGAYHL